jgi:hypothetical protein
MQFQRDTHSLLLNEGLWYRKAKEEEPRDYTCIGASSLPYWEVGMDHLLIFLSVF